MTWKRLMGGKKERNNTRRMRSCFFHNQRCKEHSQ